MGCHKCCSDSIPGHKYCAHDLFGEAYLKKNRPLFSPFDQEHLINQLGLQNNAHHEYEALNDISNKLLHCEYSTLKSLSSGCNGNPRVLSLNIRSLRMILVSYNKNTTYYVFQKQI